MPLLFAGAITAVTLLTRLTGEEVQCIAMNYSTIRDAHVFGMLRNGEYSFVGINPVGDRRVRYITTEESDVRSANQCRTSTIGDVRGAAGNEVSNCL